jgi:hypothetical protein
MGKPLLMSILLTSLVLQSGGAAAQMARFDAFIERRSAPQSQAALPDFAMHEDNTSVTLSECLASGCNATADGARHCPWVEHNATHPFQARCICHKRTLCIDERD